MSLQCFAVRSLGWVEMAEEDLAPGKSSVAVNNCIRQLSYCKNDIRDTVGIWGEVRDSSSFFLMAPTCLFFQNLDTVAASKDEQDWMSSGTKCTDSGNQMSLQVHYIFRACISLRGWYVLWSFIRTALLNQAKDLPGPVFCGREFIPTVFT